MLNTEGNVTRPDLFPECANCPLANKFIAEVARYTKSTNFRVRCRWTPRVVINSWWGRFYLAMQAEEVHIPEHSSVKPTFDKDPHTGASNIILGLNVDRICPHLLDHPEDRKRNDSLGRLFGR